MVKNIFQNGIGKAQTALELKEYYVWDVSVIKAEGKYQLFCSRWPRKYGFGVHWLFHSEVIRCESDSPEGPYEFREVILPARGREYFDGMNTHNPTIREFQGKYYLYYMGTTYGGEEPQGVVSEAYYWETWNRKRIGLAVADGWGKPFVRKDRPILEPRDCSHWDCTITTNPSPVILPDGTTYLMYKSRRSFGAPLQLGMAIAENPEGPFRRLSERPILELENPDLHVEDPFFWYDASRKKFCLIAKDDCKNGCSGITGEWGSGFYAESEDAVRFEIAEPPTVYRRTVTFADGSVQKLCNMERPSLLMENGIPTHLFCATGNGNAPYDFTNGTKILVFPIKMLEK